MSFWTNTLESMTNFLSHNIHTQRSSREFLLIFRLKKLTWSPPGLPIYYWRFLCFATRQNWHDKLFEELSVLCKQFITI